MSEHANQDRGQARSTASTLPHVFTSTAPFYARYRPGYPADLYAYLADRLGLDGTQRVLDLGTGTGTLALGLAGRVREVVAIDPEPGMLDQARRLAQERGITNVDWRQGDSGRLQEMNLGDLHLVVMGQSFHWTDREHLLTVLDDLLPPAGAVVIVGGPRPGTAPAPPWADVVDRVRTRHLGPERRAGSGTYSPPTHTHDQVLARSPFSRLETAHWERPVTRTRDDVIGLQLSYSYSSPAQLGNSRAAFEQDLRSALDVLEPSGTFVEHVHTEAIIATRPDHDG